MKITDETLSAFLDNELTDAEMEAVRSQLAHDPSLADRLADMASVDAQLQKHYAAIDDRPMPEAVTRLLEQEPAPDTARSQDNVVTFPWWRTLRGHAGKAVAAAVIAGVALMQWFGTPSSGGPSWQTVAQALNTRPSGQMYEVTSHATLTPRLTFRNQAGEWCRQFRLVSDGAASEQIACRTGGGSWEQVARVKTGPLPESGNYQTATGGSMLDSTLDRMMAGPPVGPEKERELLQGQWRN
jgi:negative regulator of sigma E activity